MKLHLLTALTAASVLAACGGGGGSSDVAGATKNVSLAGANANANANPNAANNGNGNPNGNNGTTGNGVLNGNGNAIAATPIGRYCEAGPGDKPEPLNGYIPLSAMYPANPDGFQGYWCGVKTVAQHTLFGRGAFGDLQITANPGKNGRNTERCAYASNRDGAAGGDAALTSGIIVFNMKTPTKMQVVPASGDTTVVSTARSATVTATSTNKWGEETRNGSVNPNGKILRTPASLEAYSGFELYGNLMVAGYKDNVYVDVFDVSDCLNPVPLSAGFVAAGGHHDGWMAPDGTTWYGVPFSTAAAISGGTLVTRSPSSPLAATAMANDKDWSHYVVNTNRVDLHVTDLSDPKNPKTLLTWNRSQLPEEVKNNENWRIMAATNIHDVSTNPDGSRVYLAVYGGGGQVAGNIPTATTPFWMDQTCSNGLLILDSSDIAKRVPNPQLKYVSYLSWCEQRINNEFEQPTDGNQYQRRSSTSATHATEWVRHINGKEYVVTTDESYALTTNNGDGIANGLGQCQQQSFGRMIDISDEKNPTIVGTFSQKANERTVCPALARGKAGVDGVAGEGGNVPMIHYLNFDDRENMRVTVYASASGGIRFVDWADPKNPKEIAYFVKPRNTATVMDFTRPDPRYDAENCLYYTGWNQGGLVSMELNNPEYNPCMSRAANVKATVKTAVGNMDVSINAGRNGNGAPATAITSFKVPGHTVQLNSVTRLGSALDADGEKITATENSIQIDGQGTFDGKAASFRIQVTDNGSNSGEFAFACTAGCDFVVNGSLAGNGNQVTVSQK
jgi:hypothetical protein